jgi:hypothetical protein
VPGTYIAGEPLVTIAAFAPQLQVSVSAGSVGRCMWVVRAMAQVPVQHLRQLTCLATLL